MVIAYGNPATSLTWVLENKLVGHSGTPVWSPRVARRCQADRPPEVGIALKLASCLAKQLL